MSIFNKYSSGRNNSFNKANPFKNIQFGVVIEDDKVQVSTDSESKQRKDERFNADSHAIRVRLIGEDNKEDDSDIANCFPLMPKHLNFKPSKDEMVLVFMFGENEKKGDRYYIGPFISSEDKLGKDTIDGTATAHLQTGLVGPSGEISRDPNANGIYEDTKHVVIEGRDNTDIIQKSGEVVIRAGKFKLNQRRVFNDVNPGYFQLKFNQPFKEKTLNDSGIGDGARTSKDPKYVTVTNIVSNKINLLSHDGDKITDGDTTIDLTTREDGAKGSAKYISDDEMDVILNNAHPLVFGDILLEYLRMFKTAFLQHVHNPAGAPSTDIGTELTVEEFTLKAKELEKQMLSKNIRIN